MFGCLGRVVECDRRDRQGPDDRLEDVRVVYRDQMKPGVLAFHDTYMQVCGTLAVVLLGWGVIWPRVELWREMSRDLH